MYNIILVWLCLCLQQPVNCILFIGDKILYNINYPTSFLQNGSSVQHNIFSFKVLYNSYTNFCFVLYNKFQIMRNKFQILQYLKSQILVRLVDLCAPGSRSVLITIKIETRYSNLLSECHTRLFINLSDILIIERWCYISKQLDIQRTG